ncbi:MULTISPECIES: hypothetical protein [unclassified Legionella]|uniref:hypothetical protein n=1 Tax=unclassified Legionella TaxID=2622702 RepID=UPI003AF6C358
MNKYVIHNDGESLLKEANSEKSKIHIQLKKALLAVSEESKQRQFHKALSSIEKAMHYAQKLSQLSYLSGPGLKVRVMIKEPLTAGFHQKVYIEIRKRLLTLYGEIVREVNIIKQA